ncbi:MAG: winged helix-turn-helix transcriptional regulator [Candidatus Dormibacteraeota bacterium]|nr:winged helix-turn-helix transcriptional regulator [Candidatus Dormibacteraeota bacterium]
MASTEPSPRFHQDETFGDLCLAAAFRRGFRQALVLMNRALAEHDLSPLQYHLLLEAGAAGELGVVQGDLAELLQTPEARISLLVHDLGERGLLTTQRGAPDRRVVRVGITGDGCALVAAALQSQRRALRDLAGSLADPGVTEMLQRAMELYLGVDIAAVSR